VVGLVHASWRCTCALATRQVIETMRARFGCDPGRMLAGIGPSAGPERYEVKQDVFDAARDLLDRERFFIRRGECLYFDLWAANRAQLEVAGVQPKNIETAGVCTMTDTERFYSFRREGAGCGHFGLMAGLR
jgi:copper oxidase (laccase) domain-containing protein